MTVLFRITFCITFFAPALHADEPLRTWETKSGVKQLGLLHSFDARTNKVTILVPYTLDVELLTDADQAFIKNRSSGTQKQAESSAAEDYKIHLTATTELINKAKLALPRDKVDMLTTYASENSVNPDLLLCWGRAAGFADPRFNPELQLPVNVFTELKDEELFKFLMKYEFSEIVFAWLQSDKDLSVFVDPTLADELYLTFRRTMLLSALQVLEVAEGKPLFAGLPYATKPQYSRIIATRLNELDKGIFLNLPKKR